MKKTFIALAILMSPNLIAQKENYRWIIGHDYNIEDSLHGRVEINFNTVPPTIDYRVGNSNMNMFGCNSSISDSAGNLLFYSNGCNIANQNGDILFDGDNINPGLYHEILCDDIGRGYTAGYPSIIILPVPEKDSLFFIFHKSVKYVPAPNEYAYVDRLLYSKVNVKGNKKMVLEKNFPFMVDSLSAGEMNAVKHANGKDWWIISSRRNSNQFYMFLFTKDGIVDTLIQTIGNIPPPDKEGYGQTTFSPDGGKMIRFYPHEAIGIYHFDRSTGLFTDFDTIHIDFGNFISFDGGCAVSPNGRYLYITAVTKAYQFDLLASDISSTQTTIATWDGFIDPIAIAFWLCQLGPDCKIYVIGGGDTRYYHVIHNPDEPGLACNFEQRGLVLPIPSGASIPYFPNYRLGSIDNPGLPCSVVVSANAPSSRPVEGIRVFPNPAVNQITLAFSAENKETQITLRTMYGQIVRQTVVTGQSDAYTLSLENLASGMYLWEVTNSSGIRLGAGKLIKQ